MNRDIFDEIHVDLNDFEQHYPELSRNHREKNSKKMVVDLMM